MKTKEAQTQVKDPIAHVQIWGIMETLTYLGTHWKCQGLQTVEDGQNKSGRRTLWLFTASKNEFPPDFAQYFVVSAYN